MSMQQRPTRYYITRDEDQTVVRSVPIARRAQGVLSADERNSRIREDEQPRAVEPQRSVADRFRAAVRRGPAGGKR
jgi:hypothetical protein